MHYAVFDTHKHIKELQACGFDEKQAEVLVKSLLHSRDYDLERLATKEQITILQKDIASIKKDSEKFATKEQITTLQHEMEFVKKDVQILDDKISNLGENIKKDMQALDESVKKDAKILDDKISILGENVKKDIKTLEMQMVTYVGIMKWSATLLVTVVLGVISILVKVW